MTLDEYQRQAQSTDTSISDEEKHIIVPLLGLSGEAATLLSAYKKRLRDGPAYAFYKEEVAEELGDVLWYLSTLASHFDLSLETIAQDNLHKTQDRFQPRVSIASLDLKYPFTERFPRNMEFVLTEDADRKVRLFRADNGKRVGDSLTDNAYDDDGYRYHDAFHLAYVAVLGWSPVIRGLLGLKRKSDPKVDEVEDGGRAKVIDEGIAAFVFGHAVLHKYFDGVNTVDYSILRTIHLMTAHLEVSTRTTHDWENAIIQGYRVFRALRENHGGRLILDLNRRQIEFREL